MILRPKPEISVIRQHIDELQAQPWLDQARQWWPVYLFHCTDILNVVSILRDGEIASRSRITGAGQLALDIASPQVIASTDPQWRNCVRLYFRPRTPTQFRNEGFRPIGQWQWNSHCPVPVYLMFDALSVLSRSDSRFSDGNLVARNHCNDGLIGTGPLPGQTCFTESMAKQSGISPIISRMLVY